MTTSSSHDALKAQAAAVLRACPQCGRQDGVPLAVYSTGEWTVARCPDCSFVYLRNPPGYAALEQEFAWEKTSHAEKERRRRHHPVVQGIDRATRWRLGMLRPTREQLYRRIFPAGRVLDIGCGSGEAIPDAYEPYGIEISQALFRKAEANMARRGGFALLGPAAERIGDFPEGFFSGVILSSTLEHEEQPSKLLRGIRRVLADEGVVYVRVPNFGSVNRLVMRQAWCGIRHPDHVNYFTLATLRQMCAGAGLRLRPLGRLGLWVNDNINALLTAVP